MNTITKPTDEQLAQFGRVLDDDNDKSRLESLRAAWALAEKETCAEIESLLTPAALDVMMERRRQVDEEGFSHKHDDAHEPGDLAAAGSAYALATADVLYGLFGYRSSQSPPRMWPTRWKWKPSTPRTMLVKAVALLLAQIERLDREESKKKA